MGLGCCWLSLNIPQRQKLLDTLSLSKKGVFFPSALAIGYQRDKVKFPELNHCGGSVERVKNIMAHILE